MDFKRGWRQLIFVLTIVLLIVPMATAQAGKGGVPGPPEDGGRPPDKGPPPGLVEEEGEVGNNLSIPALFAGGRGAFSALACDGNPIAPTGVPLSGYPVAGEYFVQGIHSWQAACSDVDTATATVKLGDNLAVGESIKAGTPIRVEIGLLDTTTQTGTMLGYEVIKLEPNLLDRDSAYGTLATDGEATPETGAELGEGRVFDPGATFSLCYADGSDCVVEPGTLMGSEINSTGRVLYGYGWGTGSSAPPLPGDYVLTFTTSAAVTLSGDGVSDGHTFTFAFTVAPGGGQSGGGGGGQGPPDDPGGGNGGGQGPGGPGGPPSPPND